MNHNDLTANKGWAGQAIILLCATLAAGGFVMTPFPCACASDDSLGALRTQSATPPAAAPTAAPATGDQVEEFTRIIDLKLKSEFALAYIGRGDAYRRRGEMDAAITDYSKAIELKPDYAKTYVWRGYAYAVKHQDELATRDFARAIEMDPRDPLPYSYRGLANLNRGNYDAAIADFNKALGMKADSVDDYANRALAYYYKNDFARAVEDYNRAIGLRPNDPELYARRAQAKRGMLKSAMEQVLVDVKTSERLGGRVDSSLVSEMNRLSGTMPSESVASPRTEPVIQTLPAPEARPAVAAVQPPAVQRTELPPVPEPMPRPTVATEPAVTSLPSAEPPKPTQNTPAPGGMDISRLLAKVRETPNFDEQINLLTQAIQLDTQSAAAFAARGDAYMMKADYDHAIIDYARAIGLNPAAGTPHNNRGVAYVRKGDNTRALQDFNQAIQLDPTLAGAYYNRADANVALGNHDLAIADYTKVIGLKPDDPDSYQGRAMAYYQKHAYNQAWADVMMCRRCGGKVQPEFEAALSAAASPPKAP